MRRAAKVDSNQAETVAYLRKLGFHVAHTHTVGGGFPDLVVSKRVRGLPWATLLELKSPGGKLTPDEREFGEQYLGPLLICYGPEDCAAKLLREIYHSEMCWRQVSQGEA